MDDGDLSAEAYNIAGELFDEFNIRIGQFTEMHELNEEQEAYINRFYLTLQVLPEIRGKRS